MAVKQVTPFLPFLHAAVVTEFATAAFLWDSFGLFSPKVNTTYPSLYQFYSPRRPLTAKSRNRTSIFPIPFYLALPQKIPMTLKSKKNKKKSKKKQKKMHFFGLFRVQRGKFGDFFTLYK